MPFTSCCTSCSLARCYSPQLALPRLLSAFWARFGGIYHALIGIASAGQITIDKVSGPVGEALIMTAAGLAVAIPAVLAYNIFGRHIGRIEADLEGFARDLRELMAPTLVTSHAFGGTLPPSLDAGANLPGGPSESWAVSNSNPVNSP